MERTPPPTDIETARRKRSAPVEWVYACLCGGQLFFLIDDGHVQCAECKTLHERIFWAEPGALNP
jgi:hypothetical protein